MRLGDVNNNVVLAVDKTGCTAVTFSTVQHGQVIDAAGNWHGQPIGGSQTPWASNIAGAGFSLTNVGALQVNGATTTGSLAIGSTGDGISGAGAVTRLSIFCGRHAGYQHRRAIRCNPYSPLRASLAALSPLMAAGTMAKSIADTS